MHADARSGRAVLSAGDDHGMERMGQSAQRRAVDASLFLRVMGHKIGHNLKLNRRAVALSD